ncbi:MAG: hypothetical protein ABI622_09735 [Chloroflexota bacterium]
MKRLSFLLAIVAAFTIAGSAFAAPPAANPAKNPLQCGGSEGAFTLISKSACLFDVEPGEIAYAYYGATGRFYPANAWDQPLGSITQLSFKYTGDVASGGSPRFSLQIDPDGYTGAVDCGAIEDPCSYALIPAETCNNGAGLVDVINDPTCLITYQGVTYDNWADFIAGSGLEDASLYFAFVIADSPGTWTVSNIKIGKPGA